MNDVCCCGCGGRTYAYGPWGDRWSHRELSDGVYTAQSSDVKLHGPSRLPAKADPVQPKR